MDYNLMWLCILVFLVIAEAVSIQLVAIWFALGALGALIASFFGADIIIQIVVFVVVSLLTLLLSRPLAKKLTAQRSVKTNFDRIVSMTAAVTEKIDNLAQSGYVTVDGKEWMARTQNGEVIEAGQSVKVLSIDGAKVIVEKIQQ